MAMLPSRFPRFEGGDVENIATCGFASLIKIVKWYNKLNPVMINRLPGTTQIMIDIRLETK
jgi:hypothetical protein